MLVYLQVSTKPHKENFDVTLCTMLCFIDVRICHPVSKMSRKLWQAPPVQLAGQTLAINRTWQCPEFLHTTQAVLQSDTGGGKVPWIGERGQVVVSSPTRVGGRAKTRQSASESQGRYFRGFSTLARSHSLRQFQVYV